MRGKKLPKFAYLAGGVIGVLSAFYLFGVGIFWGRFPLHTTVNGRNVTLLSPSDVTVDMLVDTQNQMLTLHGKNGSFEQIKFADLGVYRASDLALSDIKLNPWKWLSSVWNHYEYRFPSDLFYDRKNIAGVVKNLQLVNGEHVKNPSDAYMYDDGSSFELIQMNDGTCIDTDKLFQVICEHLDNYDLDIDLEKEDCYVKSGEVNSDKDVKADVQDLNALQNEKITLKLDDVHTEVVPDSIMKMVSYEKDGTVMVRSSILSAYVDALASKYNTRGMARAFRTSKDQLLTLIPQTNDTFLGYELNKSDLLQALVNSISSGKSVSISVPWNSLGGALLNKDSDIGDTYIEVSIDDQHMWFYKDGNLVADTDVVTGLDTDERRTPTGLFYVMSLNTNYTMYYSDGSAMCNYFIKVTADGVGIHDTIRSSYGGDIYKTYGSHGCINTPYDVEKTIFTTIADSNNHNIPVVIY